MFTHDDCMVLAQERYVWKTGAPFPLISFFSRSFFLNYSWQAVEAWMSSLPLTVKHLFLVATVPVVYPHRTSVDYMLDKTNHNLLDDW